MNIKFWVLRSPQSNRGLAEWDHDAVEKLGGANALLAFGGGPRLNLPVLLTSKKIRDFVWTWYSDCLIQDHVLRMFQEEGFTGFEVRPVDPRMKIRKKPEPMTWEENPGVRASEVEEIAMPTLWDLIATGWGGVAPEESGIHLVSRYDDGSPKYSAFTDASKLMDESQWDGSDFFSIWPTGRRIYVSDRVAKFIRRNKLTGSTLLRIEDLKMNPRNPLIPGGLRYWLPEEKARAIGEPLGIY